MQSLFVIALFTTMATFIQAAEPGDEETDLITPEEFLAALQPQQGQITLPNGIATLALTDEYQYLNPESTEALLVQGWGNPPGSETLGMIIPTSNNPLEQDGWGVVITYSDDGYVSDTDAADINYDELLQQMKADNVEENKMREEAGYEEFKLVGWAEPPNYDAKSHKLNWAMEFASPGSADNSLNYNIRVLGREGVLVLNAVAGVNQLATIRSEMPTLLAITEFSAGKRYEEFDASTDRVAEYGLAALVAGGVAAKMGLFTKLAALIIAFKKVFLIGGAALIGLLAKWFTKKKSENSDR